MPATVPDGRATAAAIRAELSGRVAVLTAAGLNPGLRPGPGTLLVGDDPAGRRDVDATHSDCAQVGIAGIQRELPATATLDEVLVLVDELDADPACTGYIVQLPLPKGVEESVVLERMDPAEDADGLHPVSLGRLVLDVPGLVTAGDVGPGAAVLDVSRVGGRIAGDVAPGVADVAGFVAPDPGGVGPMTRAMSLHNVVLTAERTAAARALPV